MKTDNVIKAVGLTKIFRTESVQTTALNEVNLEIYPGEFAAIKSDQSASVGICHPSGQMPWAPSYWL